VLFVRRSLPARLDLEYLNVLPRNAEPKIQLRPNVWRRPTLLHEGIQRSTHSRQLDLSERHGRYATLRRFTVCALRLTLRHFLIASKIAARLSMLGLPLADSIL
jgi:hypothetical protein